MAKKEGGLVGYLDKQKGGKPGKSMFPSLDQIQKGLGKPKVRGGKTR